MRTNIRKVGNSRGVIIPAALLAACELGEEVELTVQGKTLVIEALKTPRQNWFAGFKPEQMDDDVWSELPPDEGDEEWSW
jgi:antitoxin MazE